MKYERLTDKIIAEMLRNTEGESWDSDNVEAQCYIRLAELEDKIERGELISTQLKDRGEQEFAFFVNHSRSVRKLFADELEARLQDAVALGNITRKVYDVIESEINYCLGEVKQ